MIGGIAGKILTVNLSEEKVSTGKTREDWIKTFAGGAGYASRILFEHFERKVEEPFSPGNPLIIMTGPTTGVSAFGSKTIIVSRSPLTYGLGKTTFAGSFGLTLKKAGFDGIVVVGVSEKPVYLTVDGEHVDLKPAGDLWGLDALEAQNTLRKRVGEEFRSIAIGVAGERLSRIASIISFERRVAGRTGLGAVMGFKKLKAIAVRGENPIQVYDNEELRRLNGEWLSKASKTERGQAMSEYGTAGGVSVFITTGNLPIKHWTRGVWDKAGEISGVTIMEKYRYGTGRKICGEGVLCSIACERVVQFEDSRFGRYTGKGPEYETVAALGSMVLNSDVPALIKLNEVCDRLGIDTISTGEVVAWAMEAYEKGILNLEDTGGVKLRWGDVEVLFKLVDMIGRREGVGALLSEGVKRASERIGRGADRFALHVKGLEIPYHNPRLYKTMGLAYATSNRGACHLQGMAMLVERGVLLPEYGITEKPKTTEERVKTVIVHQNLCAYLDSAILCKFGVFGIVDFNHIAEVWSATTGLQTGKEDLLSLGERIWYLERILNYMMGFTNRDDTLPRRFTDEPLEEGPAKGLVCDDLQQMLDIFYKRRKLRTIEELKAKLREIGLQRMEEALSKIKPG